MALTSNQNNPGQYRGIPPQPMSTPTQPETEDVQVFGKDQYVYCSQHLRPHRTGWCTVPVAEKLGLGTDDSDKAFAKCQKFKLLVC